MILMVYTEFVDDIIPSNGEESVVKDRTFVMNNRRRVIIVCEYVVHLCTLSKESSNIQCFWTI